jgi:lysophospholipase L1-like esterase
MYWLLVVVLVLLLLVLTEVSLRTSEVNTHLPNVGYGSVVDEDFEHDKSNFDVLKRRMKLEARDWNQAKFDFESSTLNFKGGWRVTTDTPDTAHRRVHIFGGSTVLCIEVRDSETLTSYLQRELNVISGSFSVVNRGISGATIAGGLSTFDDLEVGSDDTVIVYFGINDAKLNKYCQKPRGFFSFFPGWVSIIGLFRLKLKLRIAQWIWLETVHLDKKRQLDVSRNRAHELMLMLDSWEAKVRARGGTFIAVLQPHIWLKKRSEAEIALSRRVVAATSTVLGFQYEAFHNVIGNREYFRTFELAFEGVLETVFTDWAHTNKRGNEVIAKRFAKEVHNLTGI